MAGWLFDVPSLKSVMPGLATMKANTALGLCLSGASLWLWPRKPETTAQPIARALGLIVALLGALTLGEYILGRDFGIDELLFRDAPGAVQTPYPGRMSPLSALDFLLSGLALGWLRAETRDGHRPAEFLALAAASIAAMAVIGYLYSVATLYRLVSYTGMAVHTALAFSLMSAGILTAWPERGLMALSLSQGGGGKLVRHLLPVTLLSLLALNWLITAGGRHGMYEPALVVPLGLMASLVITTLLIWSHAKVQQRTEQELRDSEARYRGLAELSPDAIFINTDNRISYVNPALVKLLGASGPEQILGRSPFEIIHADDHPLVRKRIRRVLNGEVMPLIAERFVKLDGTVVPVEVAAAPHQDHGGRGIQVVLRDISERTQTEQALQDAYTDLLNERNRLEAVMQALPVGVAIVDAQGGNIRANRAFELIWGGPRLPTQSVRDYAGYQAWWLDTGQPVQPEDWASAQAVQEGKTVVGQVMEIARFDGSRAFVHNSAAPIRDAGGQIVGSAVAIMDISESVRHAQVIREREERYRLAIEAAQLGTWDWDLLSNQMMWNPHHSTIFGYPPKDGPWDYQAFAARVHPEDWRRVEAALAEARDQRSRYALDYRLVWPDGELRWVSAAGDFQYDEHDRPVRMIGVIMDITERKHIEAKLADQAQQLRAADRRKDEFLAMLAHELRNPLAPIRNAVRLLKKLGPKDPQLEWSRDVIDRQVSHMARLLDDLLDVARIMRGKITLKTEPIRLTDAIERALEATRPSMEAKKQILTVSLPATLLWIQGDLTRLAQVLGNLLDNAMKYTNEGGRITLNVTSEAGFASILIQDTGMGIAPELLPQVFDLFIQADQSLGRSEGGLGIGLTLVRQLVQMHGGTVTASSAGLGQGSEFTVRLPLLQDWCPVAEPRIASSDAWPSRSASKLRILVVDDYPDAAQSLMLLLKAAGHEVETADCGAAALERVPSLHPEVVLIDIGLPDLNGYQVAQRLREIPETRQAILIALTGYGNPEDRERARSAGFDHFLLKPPDIDALSAVLATVE